MNTKKIMEANFKKAIYDIEATPPTANKLSSDSLFLIEELLKREKCSIDTFRFQVANVMQELKLSDQIKVYNRIDKRTLELDKACREIHHCFERQFEGK